MSQVNKSFLKFTTDFGPLAIFFYYYYNNDKNLAVAIPPTYSCNINCISSCLVFGKKNTNDAFNKWNFNYFFWWAYNLFQ